MRLRTLESFWLLKNGLLYTYPMLRQSLETEIIVVGGGITGALISHALIDAGYKVVLLDKRDIGQGSTSATTSMLQYEIDVPLYKLQKMIGKEAADYCYLQGVAAIHHLEELITTHKLRCDFQNKQSLYIAHNRRTAKWLKKEYDFRKNAGLHVSWLDAEKIEADFEIVCKGGILSETAASIDAYQLTHELIHFNCKRGMQVYDQTDIEHINFGKETVIIKTRGANTVKAQKIIFCTGYEATAMLKEKIASVFYTWACISEEGIKLPEVLKNTLVWNTEEPYLYMRTTGDNRMLIGGEDSSYNSSCEKQKLKERKSKALIKKLKALMPNVDFEEDFNWGGAFGSTKDGLPYIGKSPEYKNAFFVLGFGGNGITFSVQGMKIIIDLLQGKDNELARCYRFGR